MNIGFDVKRAFHNRTGLGNYSRTLIESLAEKFPGHQYFLFNPKPSTKNRTSALDHMQEMLPSVFILKLQPILEEPVADRDFYNL